MKKRINIFLTSVFLTLLLIYSCKKVEEKDENCTCTRIDITYNSQGDAFVGKEHVFDCPENASSKPEKYFERDDSNRVTATISIDCK